MKKILLLLGTIYLGACVTLTPEQKRELFEQQVSKPELKCELQNVGERPIADEVSVSLDDVDYYDISMCTPGKRYEGLRPVQIINSRELIAYPCAIWGCMERLVYFQFPYAIKTLGPGVPYTIPNDICESNKASTPYRYVTISGFENTIESFRMVRKRIYSKQERQQMLKALKKKKQKEAQAELDKQYEDKKNNVQFSYNYCKKIADALVVEWQEADNLQNYCKDIEYALEKMIDRDRYTYKNLNAYYINTCGQK